MRKFLSVLIICVLAVAPVGAAFAQSEPEAAISKAQIDPAYPFWLGAGALVGALAFNLLWLGPQTLPIFPGMVAPGTQITPYAAMALARVYAGTSAVVGAILADRWYTSRS